MSDLISETAIPLAQKSASVLSYAVGTGLFFGDVINWLDSHAGTVGALIGIATFSVNLYFHCKRRKGDA